MIKLLVIIYNDEKKVKNLFKKHKLTFNAMTYGSGTASSSLLNYFGLDEIKKNISCIKRPNPQSGKAVHKMEENICKSHTKRLIFRIHREVLKLKSTKQLD